MKGHPVPSRFTPWLLHLLMVLLGLTCAESSCYWCWWKTSWIRPKGSAKDWFLSCLDTLLFLLGSSYDAECPRAQKYPQEAAFGGLLVASCMILASHLPVLFLQPFWVTSQAQVALGSRKVLSWVLRCREALAENRSVDTSGGKVSEVRATLGFVMFGGTGHSECE